MARALDRGPLVIATHNKGKLAEIADLLAPFGVGAVSAGSLGLPEPEETGSSFEANALLKAKAATAGSGLAALADDSGLVVPALDGEPGIYSARWAGPKRDFGQAMQRVHERLGTSPDRRGIFVAVLALAWPDGHHEIFRGKVEGELVWPPRGTLGFGYDPMFQPLGSTRTFGEIPSEEKHRISHRARAFAKLVEACLGLGKKPDRGSGE
jgi:non-canonical purine NTP pyrophosphatase (RdgB/HAM1 family)